jgi:hypothetical protein
MDRNAARRQPVLTASGATIVGAVIVLLVCYIVGSIVQAIWVNHAIAEDPGTQSQFKAMVERSKPLVEALDAYHNAVGLYPPDLTKLNGRYLAKPALAQGFLYSALPTDEILPSEECRDREKKSFTGWIMKTTSELDAMKTAFRRDCVTGYRVVSLQSPTITSGGTGTLTAVERWAYYDSLTRGWSIGWCSVDQQYDPPRHTAYDGVCR